MKLILIVMSALLAISACSGDPEEQIEPIDTPAPIQDNVYNDRTYSDDGSGVVMVSTYCMMSPPAPGSSISLNVLMGVWSDGSVTIIGRC